MKSFEIFLGELIDKIGQGTLADKIGVDPATLSRFRSGQGTISIKDLEKLLALGDGAIISRSQLRKMEDALEVVSDLWKKSRKANGNNLTRREDNGKS